MRVEPSDELLNESELARKPRAQRGNGDDSAMSKAASILRGRKPQLAAGMIAGLAVFTAGAIFYQQNRRLKRFWQSGE